MVSCIAESGVGSLDVGAGRTQHNTLLPSLCFFVLVGLPLVGKWKTMRQSGGGGGWGFTTCMTMIYSVRIRSNEAISSLDFSKLHLMYCHYAPTDFSHYETPCPP